MAPQQTVQDPPVSAREKGERIVIVFNVANVKSGSVKVEFRPQGGCASVFVQFSAVSPARHFEKLLDLPHEIVVDKTVRDVQSKCLIVQLLKADSAISWGVTWVKDNKCKGKTKRPSNSPGGDSAAAAEANTLQAASGVAPSSAQLLATESSEQVPVSSDLVKEKRLENDEICAGKNCKGAMHDKEATKEQKEPAQAVRTSGKEDMHEKKVFDEQNGSAQEVRSRKHPSKHCEQNANTMTHTAAANDIQKNAEKTKGNISKNDKVDGTSVRVANGDTQEEEASTQPETVSKRKAKRERSNKTSVAKAASETEAIGTAGEPVTAAKTDANTAKEKPIVVKTGIGNNASKAKSNSFAFPGSEKTLVPSDPKIKELLDEANTRWESNPQQASNFFKLAARKGFLPAYVCTASLAEQSGNNNLVMEALTGLLSAENARKQLPAKFLERWARHLADMLHQHSNKDFVRGMGPDLEKIRSSWTSVVFPDAPTGNGHERKVEKSNAANEQEKPKAIAKPVQRPPKKRPSSPETNRAPAPAPKSASAAVPPAAAEWFNDGDEFKFKALVEGLPSLSEGRLEMLEDVIQLSDNVGSTLLKTKVPAGTDSGRVRAKWHQRSKTLQLALPSLPGASQILKVQGMHPLKEGGLNGVWKDEDDIVIGTVSGCNMTWVRGCVTELRKLSSDTIVLFDGKDEVVARVSDCNRLEWSDGDVWIRERLWKESSLSTMD